MKINENLAKTFDSDTKISFKRTGNLRETIGGKTIINTNIKRKTIENMNGKCSPCSDKKSMM